MITWGKGLVTFGILVLAGGLIFGAWYMSNRAEIESEKTSDALYFLAVIEPKWETFASAVVPDYPANYISLLFAAIDQDGKQYLLLVSMPEYAIYSGQIDFNLVYIHEVRLTNATIPRFKYVRKTTQHLYSYVEDEGCWKEVPYSARPDVEYACVDLATVK